MMEMKEDSIRLGDPIEALLALYRQPHMDKMKAPGFGRPDAGTLPVTALFKRKTMDRLLRQHTASYGESADCKAAASIWSKHFFSLVSSPTLVANLLLGQGFPLQPDQLRVELGERSQVKRLWLRDGGQPLASQALHERFAPLFEGLCAPLVDVLAELSGLSPKVYWSNLGHYVEILGQSCSRHSAFLNAGEPLLRFLDTPMLPDGRRNPLYQPVRYLELGGDTPNRVRRLCCIKYRLPDEPLCGACPLKPENCQAKRHR